ncbi:hypothetical protein [Lentzea waywayandensis]|uniref:hypothetical protein n=1 Tax=Lentzea waywayandensis TaxID=84724 RepID=UPI0011600FDF|nr:hypothetical protein [Lentzea waywayandensis]
MDLVLFRRVSTAVMVLLMVAFLVTAVLGAVAGGHPTGLTLWLAGSAIVLGLVFAAVRTMKFAVAGDGIDTRGPLPVFLFVLFAGFIGGIGLQHTVLALQPTISVTAEVMACGYSGRTRTCAGEYTVDGVAYAGEMPVRSVPAGHEVAIEVLASDHSEVVSRSWLDIAFFRGGGVVLVALAIGYGVRWNRLARAASTRLRERTIREVHSNGSNPAVK